MPSGYLIAKRYKGIDIREHGSRNIGATNTLRVLGKKLGAITLAMDVLKGWLPVAAALWLNVWDYLPILCGLAAILGHTFSVFLRFRGGKGVATSTGVFLGLAPMPTLIAALVFGVVVAATRMVSAGSIAAAAVLSVAVFFFPASIPVRVVTVVVAALVILKHRANIQRIVKGEESRI